MSPHARPHLVTTLQRIGRAAGLTPIVLAPLLAACEAPVDEAIEPAAPQEEPAADGVDDVVPDVPVEPAATGTAPVAHAASAEAYDTTPWVESTSIVTGEHVAHFQLGNLPERATVELYAGVPGQVTAVDGLQLDMGSPTQLTTLDAGIDGYEGMRVLITAGLTALVDPGASLAFQIVVESPDGARRVSAPIEVPTTHVAGSFPVDRELHPDMHIAWLQDGVDYRACVPAEWDEDCTPITEFHDWQAREVASYALDAPLPAGTLAAACAEETAFEGSCCYIMQVLPSDQIGGACVGPDGTNDYTYYTTDGRPFFTTHGRQEAPAQPTSTWADDAPALLVPLALRETVAAAWVTSARAEHASVASFARMTMELLSLGAPSDLVARATQAQQDEIGHARLAYGVASAVVQRPIGPGPLDIAGALDRSHDLAAVLTAAIHEGCINETISSVLVRDAADHTIEPALASALHRVADDELRHAELSWAFVRWLLAEHPELHPVAREAFASFDLAGPEEDGADLSAWGVRPPSEAHRLALRILADVVQPAADALLASPQIAEA